MSLGILFLKLSHHINKKSLINFSEIGVDLFAGIYNLYSLDFTETGKLLKNLIEVTFGEGITGLEDIEVKGDNIIGVFLEQPSPSVTRRFEFKVTPSEVNYRLLDFKETLTTAQFVEWVEFTATNRTSVSANKIKGGDEIKYKSGVTKYCTPGKTYACGNRCVAEGSPCKDVMDDQQKQLRDEIVKRAAASETDIIKQTPEASDTIPTTVRNSKDLQPRTILTPVRDKKVLREKFKDWENEVELMKEVLYAKTLKDSMKNLEATIKQTTDRKREHFILPEGLSLGDELGKKVRDYHSRNLKITEEVRGSDRWYRFNGDRSIGFISEESNGFFGVSLTRLGVGNLATMPFAQIDTAKTFLTDVAEEYASRRLIPTALADEALQDIKQQLKDHRKKISRNPYKKTKPDILEDNIWIGAEVAAAVSDKSGNVLAMIDENGNLQSAANYSYESDHIYVDFLATAPWNLGQENRTTKGSGARVLAEIANLSFKKGKKGKIKLTALDNARPFYEHIGFIDEGKYSLSTEAANKLIEKYGKRK